MNSASTIFNITGSSGSSVAQTVDLGSFTGTTSLTITVSGNGTVVNQTQKLVFDFGAILQTPLTASGMIGYSFTKLFSTSPADPTTFTINVTGIRADTTIDTYTLTLSTYRPSLSAYGGIGLLQTTVFDTPTTTDNLLLTVEVNQGSGIRQNRRDLVNFVIPGKPATQG